MTNQAELLFYKIKRLAKNSTFLICFLCLSAAFNEVRAATVNIGDNTNTKLSSGSINAGDAINFNGTPTAVTQGSLSVDVTKSLLNITAASNGVGDIKFDSTDPSNSFTLNINSGANTSSNTIGSSANKLNNISANTLYNTSSTLNAYALFTKNMNVSSNLSVITVNYNGSTTTANQIDNLTIDANRKLTLNTSSTLGGNSIIYTIGNIQNNGTIQFDNTSGGKKVYEIKGNVSGNGFIYSNNINDTAVSFTGTNQQIDSDVSVNNSISIEGSGQKTFTKNITVGKLFNTGDIITTGGNINIGELINSYLMEVREGTVAITTVTANNSSKLTLSSDATISTIQSNQFSNDNNALIIIGQSKTLSISGNINNSPSSATNTSLIIKGSDDGYGTVNFNGTSAQSVNGNATTNIVNMGSSVSQRLDNIVISNTNLVTFGANSNIFTNNFTVNGNTTINGTNNQLGSVAVSSGKTLTLNNNASLNNLNNSGTMTIASGKAATIYGDVSGNGALQGAGDVIFSGASTTQNINSNIGNSSTAINTLTVSSSAGDGVIINKDIYASNSNFNAKATIAGSGNISFGALSTGVNGQLNLQNNASASSLSGNLGNISIASGKILTMGAGSTLSGSFNMMVDNDGLQNSPSISGKISANNNTTTVSNGTKFNFDFSKSNYIANSGTYDFLFVQGNLTVPPGGIIITDNSALIKVSLSNTTSRLIATNSLDTQTTDQLTVKQSANVTTISDNNLAVGNMKLLQTALYKISDVTTLKQSLDTLQPASNNMVPLTSVAVVDKGNSIITSRFAAINSHDKSGFSSGNNQNNEVGIWGQVFNNRTSQDKREGQDGYDAKTNGFMFGADTLLDGDTKHIFGAAIAYSSSNVQAKSNNNKTDIGSYQLSLYNNNSTYKGDGLYNDNIFNIGFNKYKSSRNINAQTFNTTANGDYYGIQYGIRSGLGYNFKLKNNSLITPNFALRYSRLNQSEYQETDAGNVGLEIKNQPFTNIASDTGIKVTFKNKLHNYDFIPVLNFNWIHNLKTTGQQSTSSFIAGGQQTTNSSPSLVRDIFDIGTEFNMFTKSNSSITARYDLQIGSGFKSNIMSLRYRKQF